MTDLPKLAFLVTTYIPPNGAVRLETMARTIRSWREHLKYEGKIHIHIADDGSDIVPGDPFWKDVVGDWASMSFSRQEHRGVGDSLNAGWAACHEITPITLYAVDDWSLIADLDITPWVRLLLENESVGCICLGASHPHLRGGVLTTFAQGWTISWERYAFYWGMRPALYHRRFLDAYGPLPEMMNACECERLYNRDICASQGPSVEHAILHPWQHLWSIEMGDMEPGQEVPADRLPGEIRTDG